VREELADSGDVETSPRRAERRAEADARDAGPPQLRHGQQGVGLGDENVDGFRRHRRDDGAKGVEVRQAVRRSAAGY